MNKVNYHTPVLLKETMEGLKIDPNGTYIDATFGGGGHAKEILKKLKNGKLFAFDQDKDAAKNSIKSKHFTLIQHNFRFLKNFLKYYDAMPVDGILADLGVSSHQIDTKERGFSFQHNTDLDMRMDKDLDVTAADIINNSSEDELVAVFSEYGEIFNSKTIARVIVAQRNKQPINTAEQLKDIVIPFIRREKSNKYFAKLFQALRIKVNDELEALKEFLQGTNEVLKVSGRLVIISYHSLEDRIVKHFLRDGILNKGQLHTAYITPPVPYKLINKKPIIPSSLEVSENSRARSAKLRIAEKIKPIQ